MDYMNELLTQLQEGKSVDDLATQLTKALNDANTKFQEQNKAKERVRDKKVTALREVFAAIDELLACYEIDRVSDNIDIEQLEDLVDEFDNLVQKTDELGEFLRKGPFGDSLKDYKPARKVPVKIHSLPDWKKESVEKDPIEEFLNKFVR